ncbi:MAG: vWA domain-containing protein [Planctomycetia bacterium]
MNTENTENTEHDDDFQFAAANVTAHALEQLEGDERAAVERRLADPAAREERLVVKETGQVAAALRAVRADDGVVRSPALRRAVIASLAAQGEAPERRDRAADGVVTPQPRRGSGWMNRRFAIAGALAASLLVLLTLAVTRPIELAPRAREVAQRMPDRGPGPGAVDATARPAEATSELGEQAKAADKLAVERSVEKEAAAVAGNAMPVPAAAEPSARPAGQVLAPREQKTRALESLRAAREPAAGAPPAPSMASSARRMVQAAPKDARPRTMPSPGAIAMKSATDRDANGVADERRFTADELQGSANRRDTQSGERYDRFSENRPCAPAETPLSTFSIDVDTASYANVRRFLTSGRLPPPDAVRIEELVNYFSYDYPPPAGDRPFSVTLEAAECPWRSDRRLVRIGLQGRDIDRRERPAGNLVFLVDVSGSMGAADKLPLVKQGLAMLVEELTEGDSVAIVTYAGDAGLKLPATSGDQKAKILAAIDSLSSGGATHGSAGINLAYEQAAERFIRGGVNRVILATDGDLNVGVTSDEALVDLIKQRAAGGTFLTVLGFGQGNLQDAKMEKLADNGNGVYAYIDGVREARKVLVEQLTGSTITIAKDVKIQVEFNPAQVASYRLIGYENRIMAARDFRDDRKDAGEIGAGHSVTALYELELVGDAGRGPTADEPLKYQPAQARPAPEPRVVDGEASRELLTVKLRWKKPDGDESTLEETVLGERGGAFEQASGDLRFAAAVAAFGMILRDSGYKGEATLPLVARIAGGSLGRDAGGYRAEFLDLVRKAEALRGGR